MLQRILLSLVIAAFLGVILIVQFKVRPHVQGIIDEREQQRSRAVRAEDSLRQTRTRLANTEQKLNSTEKELAQTKTDLAAANTRADNEQKRANGLKQELEKSQSDLRSTQQELSAWKNLQIPVEQVRAIIESEKKLVAEVEILKRENKIVSDALKLANQELEKYRGKFAESDPIMPNGLNGKVLVVDPKWKFVVMDIGSDDGVKLRGVLMVSREGKLVAKVRVMEVRDHISIANVMNGWELGEIMEGDLVLY